MLLFADGIKLMGGVLLQPTWLGEYREADRKSNRIDVKFSG